MTRGRIQEAVQQLKRLKKEFPFEVVDTHFHPFDVMGIVPPVDTSPHEEGADDSFVFKPGLLEFFSYDRVAKFGTSLAFSYAPSFIRSTIQDTYASYTRRRLLAEMQGSGIDTVCLLPIEPWVSTDEIASAFQSDPRYLVVGSINPHEWKPDTAREEIRRLKRESGIVGLKLHPNLQGFLPQPSANGGVLGETLRAIYAEAEAQGVYLQFHAGKSFFTKKVHASYQPQLRSSTYGGFENFFTGSRSEIFGVYNIPIIIAHAASYGVANPDYELQERAVRLHERVFFDTSGVSPRILAKTVETVGATHLVFGSDGPYNRMAYNVAFLWEAISKGAPVSSQVAEDMISVFGRTYTTRVHAASGS